MQDPPKTPRPRILLVDDNPAIHEDFRKILATPGESSAVDALEAALFGVPAPDPPPRPCFEHDSAHQGLEALERVRQAREEGRPYALAFVDVRMPPGLDGIETVARLWEIDPDVQVVICTAFSDYSWSEMIARLGRGDRLLILKKPFDPVEVQQLAVALTEKWSLMHRERERMAEVERAEQEARAYAVSLETVNRALRTTLATAEASSRAKREFLTRLAHDTLAPLIADLDAAREAGEGDAALELACVEGSALRNALADILDLCELEAGSLEPARAPCEPAGIAREVLAGLEEEARARGVSLRIEEGAGVPERIVTDAARLRRMLGQLLRNALRSSRGSELCLRLELEEGNARRAPRVRYRVSGAGRHLSRGELARLFDPFDPSGPPPAEEPGDREHPPAPALGVARRLARLLGGDLTVESAPADGSAFSLTVEAADPGTPA